MTHPTDCNLLIHEYDTTPVMSTYLLAFIVGEYDYVEGTSADGVLCRVYTPVGKKEQGSFALDITVRVLPYYKNYFGIAYPLPKLDLVAVGDLRLGKIFESFSLLCLGDFIGFITACYLFFSNGKLWFVNVSRNGSTSGRR